MMVRSIETTLFLGLSLVCLTTVHLVQSQKIPTSIAEVQQQASDLLNNLPKPGNLPGGANLQSLSNLLPNGMSNVPSGVQAPAAPTIDLPGINGLLGAINKLPGQLQQLLNGLLTNLTKMLPTLGSGGQIGRR